MSDFNDQYKLLLKNIAEATSRDALVHLRTQINVLSQSINGKGLPSYELKVHSDKLNEVIELLEGKKKTLRGARFQFKGSKVSKSNSKSKHSLFVNEPVKPSLKRMNEAIDLTHPFKNSHVFLANLDNCIVRVLGDPRCESIKVENAKNSILLLQAATSIMVNNAENCILVSNSFQLRLHNMKSCLIYPKLDSSEKRAILESCSDLKIGKQSRLKSALFSTSCDKFVAVDDFDEPVRSGEPINFSYVESSLDISRIESRTHINDDFDVMKCCDAF